MLGGIGTGIYPDALTACRFTVRWSDQIVLPDPNRSKILAEKYILFRQLYPALQQIKGD
jgi:sugar (pentulose or hexulose) kinase